MLLIYYECSVLEQIIGSATYLLHIFVKSAIIQGILTLIWAIYRVSLDVKNLRSAGLMPVILSDIFVRTFYNGNDLRSNCLFLPAKMSNSLYTFFILIYYYLVQLLGYIFPLYNGKYSLLALLKS